MDMVRVNEFIEALSKHNEYLASESDRLEGLYNALADLNENVEERVVSIEVYVPKYETQHCAVSKLCLKEAISRDIKETEAYLKDTVQRIQAGGVKGVI